MRVFAFVLLFGVLGGDCFVRAEVGSYLRRDEEWFRSEEGRSVTRNVLGWQTAEGSWPKNVDTTKSPKKEGKGTFDNGATVGELRLLARAYSATKEQAALEGFLKGLDAILKAQYASGGWPQSYPPGDGYARHITFNDGTMVRLMKFVREVAEKGEFGFVDEERRAKAGRAFERGVACIVKAQVRVEGELTAWCAQHDAVTLEPRSARAYELVSLSGAESVGVVDLLMSVERPSREVIAAVEGAVAWLEAVKIMGMREVKVDGDKKLVRDEKAPALWARFYEIGTNRPIFCGRDGVKKYSMEEIEAERRNGYAWYGNWGEGLPAKYERWRKRVNDQMPNTKYPGRE
ncbi:MAG TPA: pectate lyase [Verrucomicrobiae bacterium]